MKLIKEELNSRNQEIRDEYIKWSESHALPKSKEDIDDHARRRVKVKKNISEEQFNEALFENLLTEDTIEQAAEKELSDVDFTYKGTIEKVLDRALRYNQSEHRTGGHDFLNILFIGEAGSGKTARINAWAQKAGVNLVTVRGADLDASDFGGVQVPDEERKYASKLGSREFDNLNKPNSVLFLDEYNRAPKSVRSSLMELVNNHIIYDPGSEGQQRYLENFLFTISAINPSNMNYDTDTMDMAERSRFAKKYLDSDPKATLDYLTKRYTYKAEHALDEEERLENEGRLAIAKALLTSPEFQFDSSEDIDKISANSDFESLLSARTLTLTLNDSDGTKRSFLQSWDDNINRNRKPMAERILNNYVDVKDKANSVFDQETESEVFKKKVSSSQKVKDALSKYGITN